MERGNHKGRDGVVGEGVSRRRMIGFSGCAIAGVFSGAALAQDEKTKAGRGGRNREAGRQMSSMHDRFERLRNATDDKERQRIMMEFNAQRREEAIDRYREQLGFSDAEWQVIRPRLEAVYDLTRSAGRTAAGGQRAPSEVDSRKRELQHVLGEEEAEGERIKAGLTALRAARERARQEVAAARQSLRQLLTLRQEAQLVLSELLD